MRNIKGLSTLSTLGLLMSSVCLSLAMSNGKSNNDDPTDTLSVLFNGIWQIDFSGSHLRKFFKCMCPTQRKTCEVSYNYGCEGSYCYKVSEVKLTKVETEISSDDVLFCSGIKFIPSHTFSCQWRYINMNTCGGPSSFHSDSCRNCINLCWSGYSASYIRTMNRSKPEIGLCQSPTAIPTAATQTVQKSTATGLSQPTVATATEILSSVLPTATSVSIFAPSTTAYVLSPSASTSEQPVTSVPTVASSTTYVYATTTADNGGTHEADVGSSNDNEDVLIGLAVGLGLFVVLTIALVIVLITIIYRRQKQTRDKEGEADNRSTSRDHENENHLSPGVGNQLYFRREESDLRTSGALGDVNNDMGEMVVTSQQSPPDGVTKERHVGELNTPRTPGDDNTLYLGGDHTHAGYSIADEGGYVMYDPPMADQENQLRKVYDEIAEDNGNKPHLDHVTKAFDSPTMTPGNDPQSSDYVMPGLDGAAEHRVARSDSHGDGDGIQDERHVDREFEFLDRHIYHEIPGEGGEAGYENLSQAVSYAAT